MSVSNAIDESFRLAKVSVKMAQTELERLKNRKPKNFEHIRSQQEVVAICQSYVKAVDYQSIHDLSILGTTTTIASNTTTVISDGCCRRVKESR